MSRLFYETDHAFAIPGGALKAKTGRDFDAAKTYAEKVAKLVPNEIIIAYLTVIGLIPLIRFPSLQSWFYWGIFLLGLALTAPYLNSQAEKGKPKKVHLLVSTIAFAVWAYATSGEKILPNLYDPAIGSIVLVAFSLVSGLIPLRR